MDEKRTICPQCGKKKPFLEHQDGDVCENCARENRENQLKQVKLINAGHSHHCAIRQTYGDGECECDLYKKGYDPYAWMKDNQKIESDS